MLEHGWIVGPHVRNQCKWKGIHVLLFKTQALDKRVGVELGLDTWQDVTSHDFALYTVSLAFLRWIAFN